MKKILIFLFVWSFVFPGFSYISEASQYPKIHVSVNGDIISLKEEAFLKDGITYVPLREFSEGLGTDVNWNEEERFATAKNEERSLKCYPDKSLVVLNGKENNNIIFKNNKIFISLRNISELFLGKVRWYNDIYVAEINISENLSFNSKKYYTKDDIFWMTKIINAESAGEPMTGKIAVGNVILNRVKSKDFPNSIYEVIFDKKHGIQFEPIINGSIYNDHTIDCITAAKRALENENHVGESLYFLNPKTASNKWIPNNRTYISSIGNHDFYL